MTHFSVVDEKTVIYIHTPLIIFRRAGDYYIPAEQSKNKQIEDGKAKNTWRTRALGPPDGNGAATDSMETDVHLLPSSSPVTIC